MIRVLQHNKEKLFLIGFGLFVGIVFANVACWLLLPKNQHIEGEEFTSIEDFKKQLSDPRSDGNSKKSDGSLPFVAMVKPHPDNKIIYTLKPNLNVRFTGVQVVTNSYGMRSAEIPEHASSEQKSRLALLGDSFAFGWGVEQDKIFAKVIEDDLRKEGVDIDVLNFGVPGYSTFQEEALYEERGRQFHPKAVVVFFVHNDFDMPFFIRDEDAANGLVQSFSLMKFGAKTMHPLIEHQLMEMKGLDPNSSLKRLSEVCEKDGTKLFLVVNPRKNWREIITRLKVLRENPSIQLLDIGEEFERIVAEKGYSPADLNLPNDPHPTALRHKMYGDLIANRLVTLIQH